MELHTTIIDHPPSVYWGMTLVVLYSICFLWFVRRVSHTVTALPLTLPPLVLGTFATWIGYANTVRGLSLAGGGRGATAAGLADAMAILRFGTAATVFCAAVAVVVTARMRHDAGGDFPRSMIAITSLCWAASAAAVVTLAVFPQHGSFAFFNTSLVAAFISIALMIPVVAGAMLFHDRTVARRNQLTALGITLSLAVVQTVVAWLLVKHYTKIAMFG